MTDLELALRELDVEWPATPDLATAVSARLASEPAPRAARRWPGRARGERPGVPAAPSGGERPGAPVARRPRGWRRRFAYGLAVLALLFGGAMAVSPAARTDVLRWLGLKSVEIKREPPRPVRGAGLGLGDRTTVEALRAAGYPVRVPKDLGEPTAYATTLPAGTKAASLVYAGPVLVQTFRASATPFIEKTLGSGAQLERLSVDGKPAYWLKGAHGFAYQSGTSAGYEEQRIAGNTLLVEGDGVLLRIEGNLTRDRAVAIAHSVQ